MKHTLKILLLALLPILALGQKFPATVELDLSGYATKLELSSLQRQIDSLKGAPTKPELAKCERGPTPVAITKITSTGANVTFDALDVHVIDWRIVSVNDTTVLHSRGVANPTSNQFPISFAGLSPGQYKLLLDGVECKGHGSRNFTVPAPETPILNCPRGPDIKSVEAVTAFGLTARFDGVGVIKLVAVTRSADGNFVQYDTISPTSSSISVRYSPKLKAGTYLIRTSGVSCIGGSPEYKTFTINEDTGSGGGVPPVVVPGTYAPTTISKGLDEHMKIDWKRDGDGYLVSDLTNVSIGSNREFRYLIGGEIIKGKTPLNTYRIDGFNPVRIIKYKIKPDKVLNQWEPLEGSYYDNDAAETFSYNTSVAYQTYAFPGIQGDFLNPIPSNYNPSLQNVQWGDMAPDMQLPNGHVYVADPRPWGVDNAFKKGVTHISNFALPWDNLPKLIAIRDAGKSYNDVPRIETVFGIQKSGNSNQLWPDNTSKDWWPTGAPKYQEAFNIGQRADISNALFISEMSENESWLPPSSETFRGFYDAYMPRMIDKFGEKALVCHDYIWLGGVKLNTGKGREYYKKILALPVDQQPKNDYTPGGSLSKTNLIVETVYLSAPDNVIAQPYELIFRLKYIKQLGYTPGTYTAFVHEWKPNNMLEIDYPEGKMYPHVKVPMDPNQIIANVFLGHAFGKVYVEWGGAVKTPDKLLHRNWFGTAFHWFPIGATSPQTGFPHFKETDGYPTYYGYNGSTDITHFGHVFFADTYGKVEGGADKFLKFRIDGGKWITPQEEDFIDAYHDKRGLVHSRTLNGHTAFFYLNCFTDNSYHALEVELPNGEIWKGKVSGNGIHAKLL